jgi:hypothetical protein
MSQIAPSRCVDGKEDFVERALRGAVSNGILHGNRPEPPKLVHLRCCCVGNVGVFVAGRDQGPGFDRGAIPNPLAVENLEAEHGRGIRLMKVAADEVSFEGGGTEVHIRRKSANEQEIPAPRIQKRIVRHPIRRPSPGVRAIESGGPARFLSFTMIYQDGRSKREVVPGGAPCAARILSTRYARAETVLPVLRAPVPWPPRFRSLPGSAPPGEGALA